MVNAWMARSPEQNDARIVEITATLVRALDTEARVHADPAATAFLRRQAAGRVTRAHAALVNAQDVRAEFCGKGR